MLELLRLAAGVPEFVPKMRPFSILARDYRYDHFINLR